MHTGQSGIDLSKYEVHSVAGVLSSFLTELSNPLFTFEMYDLWMATMCTYRGAQVSLVGGIILT